MNNKAHYSRYLIIIASIVPGLGFWLIGQKRSALIMMFSVFCSLAISFISPWYLVSRFFTYLTLLLWIGQIYFTADMVKWLSENSTIRGKRLKKISTPRGLTKNQRAKYIIQKEVEQILNKDEQLIAAVFGIYSAERKMGVSIQFPLRFRYLAITDKNLVLIEMSIVGVPIGIERIPREKVKNTNYRKGVINDVLRLNLDNDRQIEMKISFRLREKTIKIVEEISI